ncbi:MAG: MFS transporter [Candidatus Dormibacteria bacterium]
MSTHSLDPTDRVTTNEPSSRRWWILAAAVTVQTTVSIIVQGYPAVVPFVKQDLHLTLAEVGVFASIPGIGMAMGVLAAGWAVDHFGDRSVLLYGGLATGLVALAALLSPSYGILLFGLVIVGVGAATPTPAGSTAVMLEFASHRRALVMSFRQTGVPAGGAIAALALPLIAIHQGWRAAIAVAALTAVVGAVLCGVFYRIAGTRGDPPPVAEKGAPRFRSLFTRDLAFVGGSGIMLVMGQYCLVSYLVLFLNQTWGVPLVLASTFLAATQLAGAVGRPFWGWFSDMFVGGSRKLALVYVSVIGAASIVAIAWLPRGSPFILMLIAIVVAGGCVIGWNGVWITLLAESAPPGLRARSIAAGLTINQPTILLGPWLFGLFVEATGSYRLGWTVLAALIVSAAWLITRAGEPRYAALAPTAHAPA